MARHLVSSIAPEPLNGFTPQLIQILSTVLGRELVRFSRSCVQRSRSQTTSSTNALSRRRRTCRRFTVHFYLVVLMTSFVSANVALHRSTQPGHPFVGRHSEYKPKGGDALQLGSKGRYGSCVGRRQVKL